jgi:hypothetical protein
MDPCGTPEEMARVEDLLPSASTTIVRPARKTCFGKEGFERRILCQRIFRPEFYKET